MWISNCETVYFEVPRTLQNLSAIKSRGCSASACFCIHHLVQYATVIGSRVFSAQPVKEGEVSFEHWTTTFLFGRDRKWQQIKFQRKLEPNVRYDLPSGTIVTFGNVECRYTVLTAVSDAKNGQKPAQILVFWPTSNNKRKVSFVRLFEPISPSMSAVT